MKDYKQIKHGFVILAEHSADAYFMELAGGLKQIIRRGYAGVYVNSQRPFNNLSSMLKRHKVNTKKLVFIDFSASLEKFKCSKNERCIRIAPSIGFEHLSLAIRESLLKLKSKKKFVFLDSITTLQLYDISEKVLYRFYEFLMDTARKGQSTLILNVSQGMAKKPFIRDLAFFVDMQIS